MDKNNYFLGIFLIILGILLLLLKFKLITFQWIFLILSIGLIIAYFFQKHSGYLISGLTLLVFSLISLLNKHILPGVNIKAFLYLFVIGIIFLILYFKQKNNILLILGFILPALGIYILMKRVGLEIGIWVLWLLIGIAFYVIYGVGYNKSGIEWPRYLARIIIVISILAWLSSKITGKFKLIKMILYLGPILLIILGIRIIYNVIKLKK